MVIFYFFCRDRSGVTAISKGVPILCARSKIRNWHLLVITRQWIWVSGLDYILRSIEVFLLIEISCWVIQHPTEVKNLHFFG